MSFLNTRFMDCLRGKRPIDFRSVYLPGDLRVMALAPHPDDFDAIGVTMRTFKENGNPVAIGVVTSGASGVADGYDNAVTSHDKERIRQNEQVESVKYFGLSLDHLKFLELEEDSIGDPVDNVANLEIIRSYMASVLPDIVFMPHWNDTNVGHQRTHALYVQASKLEGLKPVTFLNQDPKTISMRNDLYMPFDHEMAEWKKRLLRCHNSQQDRNLKSRGCGFDDRVLQCNSKAATALGQPCEYAEVFDIEFH